MNSSEELKHDTREIPKSNISEILQAYSKRHAHV
jgi:hypothetical protein